MNARSFQILSFSSATLKTIITMKTLNAMKTLVPVKAICLLTALISLMFLPAFGKAELTERIPAQPGQTLKITLQTGATVNVKTWQENAIEARMEVIEVKGGDVELSLNATNAGGEIRSVFRSPRSSHTTRTNIVIDVLVPEMFNLEISSSGGKVSVEGLKGSLSGRTAGGQLLVSDMAGSVRFSTGGGGVNVVNCRLDASIRTGGGKIHVENSVIEGGINTGGGNVTVSNSTMNGGTNTGGGSITAENIQGSYFASTGAGNIRVVLAEATSNQDLEIRLGSGSGEVVVMVPEVMQPAISVELAYTNNYRRGADILSDFTLDIEATDEWDESKGTPRKYIYGTSPAGNEDQKIRIRNTNGNVVLKKY